MKVSGGVQRQKTNKDEKQKMEMLLQNKNAVIYGGRWCDWRRSGSCLRPRGGEGLPHRSHTGKASRGSQGNLSRGRSGGDSSSGCTGRADGREASQSCH